MSKRWVIAECNETLAIRLSRELGISLPTARLIAIRGIKDSIQGRKFLQPKLADLHNPFHLQDMQKAVERIELAMRKQEKIGIFGDYDVDGIVSVVLMVQFFKLLGRCVDYYIPHRTQEGYGLNVSAIDKFKADNISLLLTVDCGIADIEEIEYANSLGMDVIVLDHHESQQGLPPAYAIVDPKVDNSNYPFRNLPACSVVFKLIWALLDNLSSVKKTSQECKDFIINAMGLVAMGTIADIAPLMDENRIFVRFGLDALRCSPNLGIQELLKSAGIDKKISPWYITYRLAPRLNAPGRVETPTISALLLLSEDKTRVTQLMDMLESTNSQRQKLEEKIIHQIEEILKDNPKIKEEYALVLWDSNWHPGVIGVVAARLVDEFHKPTALIGGCRLSSGSKQVAGPTARGSVRSIPGFNVYSALNRCKDILLTYGGHELAGGFSILENNIPAFKELFCKIAQETLKPEDLVEQILVDAELSPGELNLEMLREFSLLEPYGCGNPSPVFLAKDVKVAGDAKLIGKGREHLQFYISCGNKTVRAIGFGMAEVYKNLDRNFSIVYEPVINTFTGRESIEIKIIDVKFD
jgi:single-stranded-DNA-specific exonuclease